MAVVSLGMVNTWARFKGQLGGVKAMVQLNSENILTLWKSQMIGNDLVVLRVSLRLSWIYLPLYGHLPHEKIYTAMDRGILVVSGMKPLFLHSTNC